MKKRLLFIVNVDWFFLSHRLPIALGAMKQGWDVHVAVGMTDKQAELAAYGFTVHPLTIARGRVGARKEFAAFWQIFCLLRALKPDVVHLVTIKPVLFGGIAARMLRVPGVVAAISGLGFVYVAKGFRASLKRWLVSCLYKLALERKRLIVIFQNPDDRKYLSRIVTLPPQMLRMITGSGVDLEKFVPTEFPSGVPVVAMACRLLANKGVWEFVQAARYLRERGAAARFCLAGTIDPENPASLHEIDMKSIEREGVVELLGKRDDMERVLAAAHIVTLPSYYGEGLPKVLMEAAACGRAVITTDMPGCRDAIEPGVTGLLVPARNASALADAIEELLQDPKRCRAMGKAGRALAERDFDIHQTVDIHLRIYAELLAR